MRIDLIKHLAVNSCPGVIVADPQRAWSAEEILEYAFAKPSYGPPGEKFRYSNTNAVVLGQIIEKVTGNHAQYLDIRHCTFVSTVPEPRSLLATAILLLVVGRPRISCGRLSCFSD